MKIEVNDEAVYVLSPVQERIICHDINADEFDEDVRRRVAYIVQHKLEQCLKRMRAEWEPKLKARGVEAIPTNDEAFAQLVFSQEDYADRRKREIVNQASMMAQREAKKEQLEELEASQVPSVTPV